jgi:hypothetical protein
MTTQPTPYRPDLRRVAVRNLAVLHRAVTPEAGREEVERLTRAD